MTILGTPVWLVNIENDIYAFRYRCVKSDDQKMFFSSQIDTRPA